MDRGANWQWAFLLPRYWPTWIGVVLLRTIILLPFSWQVAVGKALGAMLYKLMDRRRHVAQVNVDLCFPELDASERRNLVHRHFEALGVAPIEMAASWWATDARLRSLVKARGVEHLKTALEAGKGAIILGSHFTTLEIGLRTILLFNPCQGMYRPLNNPLMEYVIWKARAGLADVFPRDDVRAVFRSLKKNVPVWYAPDQNYGRRHSVFADFFGQPAATITTTSRFARMSGAPVVPYFVRRLPGAQGYEVEFLAPLADFPSGDQVVDARRVNAVLEDGIRRCPEQYLWVHRRFKTRPDPGENVYAN